jgi:hypothetical protein
MEQDNRIFAVVGGCVVLAVALVAAIMWLSSGITVDAPQRAHVVVPELVAPTPTASTAAIPQIVEAGLATEDNDGPVRAAVARLSSHPKFASYLVNDRLLRRFVLAVDAIAGGYSPRDEVDFLEPSRPFLVREHEGQLVIAAGSYGRYHLVADVFASFDTEGAVELYRTFRPQLEAIYQEVGWASDDFDSRLREAVDHLLEVEVPSGQIEVEQRAIVYAYAEDGLERLTGAQKQMLRMGSPNATRVQTKLVELRQALGWPVPAPAIVTAENQDPSGLEPEIVTIAEASEQVPTDPAEDRIGEPEIP